MKNQIWTLIFTAVLAVPPFAAVAHEGDESHAEHFVQYPLHHAVFHNDTSEVNRLLSIGADVNAKRDGRGTALMLAGLVNAVESAKLLLAYGADVNAKTPDGWTSLHSAAGRKTNKLVKLLLANGADINAKDNEGITALEVAVALDDKEGAEILHNYTPGQFAHLKVTPKAAGKESDYVKAWCEKHGGEMRARLDDGSIADCLTAEYAVEFDFALPAKSYECTGQALHYANIAKRKPLCILIEKPEKSIADFAAAVRKIPPQVEVRCMNAKGEMFDCPK